MEKEVKATPKEYKEAALFAIEDSVSDYYQAFKRRYFSQEERSLLGRDIQVAVLIAESAKIDGFDITTAVLSKTPAELRKRTLSGMAGVYGLSDGNVEYLELLFEIK